MSRGRCSWRLSFLGAAGALARGENVGVVVRGRPPATAHAVRRVDAACSALVGRRVSAGSASAATRLDLLGRADRGADGRIGRAAENGSFIPDGARRRRLHGGVRDRPGGCACGPADLADAALAGAGRHRADRSGWYVTDGLAARHRAGHAVADAGGQRSWCALGLRGADRLRAVAKRAGLHLVRAASLPGADLRAASSRAASTISCCSQMPFFILVGYLMEANGMSVRLIASPAAGGRPPARRP